MPARTRIRTAYAGVHYVQGTLGRTGKPEKVYYITYRLNGKLVEEVAGRQHRDAMTPAKAAGIRADRMMGKQPSNRERRAEARAKKAAEKGRWTIDRLWAAYREHKGEYASKRADQANFKHLAPLAGKEPKTLVPLDVDRLRHGLMKTKKPQTVAHVLGLLRRLVRFGQKNALCPGVGFQIEKPKVSNILTDDLKLGQAQTLLAALERDPDIHGAAAMQLALLTGMRRSEILKLEWRDVDFESEFITIRNPKSRRDEKVPINQAAKRLLEGHPRVEGSLFVFPGKGGQRRVEIRALVARLRKAGALPAGIRPMHSLRHTFASGLASSGKVELYTLQKLLTHKSPTMTQRYAHLRDEALKKGSEVASELFSGASSGLKIVK